MKKEDLFDTLGDINNQYIKEAHMNNKRKNNFAWVKWGNNRNMLCLIGFMYSYGNTLITSRGYQHTNS